jgi:integrase
VALLLGLREGEVLGLRWSDIDVTAHTLRVGQTVQRVSGRLLLAPPKTESSKRLLPMPMKVERALARHAERQEEERAAWGEGDMRPTNWSSANVRNPARLPGLRAKRP